MTAPAKPPAAAAKPAAGALALTVNPKELLKKGREALKAGRFDEAKAFARKADAGNAGGRWGLFEDTPESLEKDVRSAHAKADKAASQVIAKQAKATFAQATAAKTDADKLTLLNQAYDLADRAATLAGPADFFDELMVFGDRPDKMKKDIDAVRIPLRGKVPAAAVAKKPGTLGTTMAANGKPVVAQPASAGRSMTTPSQAAEPVRTVGHTAPAMPPSAAATKDLGKAEAAQMVADGRRLMRQGQLVEAKAKAVAAVRVNAPFGPTEDSPDALMRDVQSEGKKYVDVFTQDAQLHLKKRDLKKADAALTAARGVAAGMGFPTRSIDEQQAGVRKALGVPMPAYPSPTVVATAAPAKSPTPALPMPALPTPVVPAAATDVAVKPAGPVTLPTPVIPAAVPAAVAVAEPVAAKPDRGETGRPGSHEGADPGGRGRAADRAADPAEPARAGRGR